MSRLAVNWVGLVAITISVAAHSDTASACQPFGSGDASVRSNGEKDEQLLSDGPNVAYYEWSDVQQAFVLVSSWYEPGASDPPMQADEVDLTEIFFPPGLNCGDLGTRDRPTRLRTVNAIITPEFRSGSLFVRSVFSGGTPRAAGLRQPKFRIAPKEVEVDTMDCDPQLGDVALCHIVRT